MSVGQGHHTHAALSENCFKNSIPLGRWYGCTRQTIPIAAVAIFLVWEAKGLGGHHLFAISKPNLLENHVFACLNK
jgi:hypothetical protein